MAGIVETIGQRLEAAGVEGRRIVAAVSGGPDSMALLNALQILAGRMGFRLETAHFNHQLRETAKRDEDIVRAYCAKAGIVLHVGTKDVAAMGGNTEGAAREARYSFMLGLLSGSDLLATAHHRGDLAESVLMNVIRGSGTRGLAGMREAHGQVIRPMLHIPKAEILEYIAANNLPFGLDETNESRAYTRNRVRLELIPALQKDYNPAIEGALEKLARHAREDEDYLNGEAQKALAGMDVRRVGKFFRGFDGRAVASMHSALGKRLLRLMLEELGRFDIDELSLKKCFSAMGSEQRTDIGHGMFARGGAQAELYHPVHAEERLMIPGEGIHASGHWRLEMKVVDAPEIFSAREDWTQHINIGYIDKIPLILRARKPGDRMNRRAGSKKVGDIMTDRKTPLALRDALPVLTAGDELLWAVGVDMAEDARVGREARAIMLRFDWVDD